MKRKKEFEWGPKEITKAEMQEQAALPVPRLELSWALVGDEGATVAYSMVYRHLLGHDERVPLGFTKIDGSGVHARAKNLDVPFRDGAHINQEMKTLRLRGFVLFNHLWRELEVTP